MTRSFFSRFTRQHSPRTKRRRVERRRRTDCALGVTGLGFENLEDRRLLAAGALDPTFGTGGIVVDNLQLGKDEHIFATAIQAVLGDDKIVVAGYQNTTGFSDHDVLVARYNSDGSRDLTFGTGGFTVFNASESVLGNIDGIHDIVVDDQNRILLFGTAGTTVGPTTLSGVLIVRLTESGLLDTSFDGDGKGITVLSNASNTP